MAISNAYKRVLDIEDNDIFLGTRAADRKTTNYPANSVADYLNSHGKISVYGQMNWKFVTTTPKQGTITFVNGGGTGTPFSQVSQVRVAITDQGGQRVVEFIDYIVGSEIVIAEQKELSSFGHYKIVGYAPDTLSGYYILSLGYIGGSGSLVGEATYDMATFTPFRDADKTYVHTQTSPSELWVIQHNLDKFPSVATVNSNNVVYYGNIVYVDTNNLTIEFSAGFSGKAYLN